MAESGIKLTDELVNAIFALKAERKSNRAIAAQLGISASVVSDYLTGKRQRVSEAPESKPVDSLAEYRAFVERKLALSLPTGIPDAEVDSAHLFDFQRDLVRWALRRGRAALFTAMGTGKTRMQGVWARAVVDYTGKPVIVFAPLAVSHQTVAELASIGIAASVVKSKDDVAPGVPAIYVTNIDRMHLFEATVFGGVVIDESSILKHEDSETFSFMTAAYACVAFRLCCTATPSPNDWSELGTHAEFLGVCSRLEMLSEYFTHDGSSTQDWRLKGHAKAAFWRFVASWAALVRSPADLGYDASAYELPPLTMHDHVIATSEEAIRASGNLFAAPASTLSERLAARRGSLEQRVAMCVEMVNADQQPWVVWARLNAESEALAKAIDGAVEVTGSMSSEAKEEALLAFSRGDARVIVSKSSISGFGMNWQHAARMAFVGVDDSFEAQFQAIGRIHRFGQRREVHVHRYLSDLETAVLGNLKRKERDAKLMADELAAETAAFVRAEIRGGARKVNEYAPRAVGNVPAWLASKEAC